MSGYGTRSTHACSALIVAAALVAAAPVFAQARPSLADRVAHLEQLQAQAQASNQNVELLNRITDLQSEIQSLRDLVEKQQFEIEQLKQRGRQQYLDLDGRLGRIEGGAAASSAPAASGDATATVAPTPTEPPLAGAEDSAAANPAEAANEPPPASAAGAEAPPALDEHAAYEQAFEALKNGQYAQASRSFQTYLEQHPDGEYAPNAHYWLGESYYVTQNYELAQASFQSLLDAFPDSAKAPDALLKLGYCQYELKQFTQARATLNQVIERYPDSTVARLAQGRLRALMLENPQ